MDAFNNCMYEQPDLWGKNLDDAQRERVLLTASTVPEDVETILDVGCGDGRIANELSHKYSVIGMDISREALKHVNAPKILASIVGTPFRNASFDLVLGTEVIEHLPGVLFREAITEIERITKKYIIISVPFKENLYASMTKCNICGKVFHESLHFQSFSERRLKSLFPSFKAIDCFTFGPVAKYNNNLLSFIARNLGRQWPISETAICPRCGSKNVGNDRGNLLSRIAECINWRVCHRLSLGKRWIIVLYARV